MRNHHLARGRRAAAAIVVAVGLLAVSTGTVAAGGRGATVIRGIQHEYGSCGNDDGYLMEGSLTGCWWVLTFDVKPLPGTATILARGVEHFDGYLNGAWGTFETEYTYTARFDGATELHGRCHHWITAGQGVFAGARGEMSFTDVVDHEPFSYPYWGNIQLGRAAGTAATLSATATARSAGHRSAVDVKPC